MQVRFSDSVHLFHLLHEMKKNGVGDKYGQITFVKLEVKVWSQIGLI